MAEPISIQQLKDASLDVKSLEEVVNGDENVVVTTRLGETYPTLSNALNQIDSKLDSADAQIKQGITSLFENGGLPATPFETLAEMETNGAALADGDYAMVTDDTVNNGLYIKTAGAWVKSGYDPLAQAKVYTDAETASAISTAVSTAKTYADTNKLDLSTVKTGYVAGNLVGAESTKILGLGLHSSGALQDRTYYDSVVIPVHEGDTFYIHNVAQQYGFENYGFFGFFDSMPSKTLLQTRIPTTITDATDADTGIKYRVATAPLGAKYLLLNSRYYATDNVWSVHRSKFDASFVNGGVVVTELNGEASGADEAVRFTESQLKGYEGTVTSKKNLYKGTIVPFKRVNKNGVAPSGTDMDAVVDAIPVTFGSTYTVSGLDAALMGNYPWYAIGLSSSDLSSFVTYYFGDPSGSPTITIDNSSITHLSFPVSSSNNGAGSYVKAVKLPIQVELGTVATTYEPHKYLDSAKRQVDNATNLMDKKISQGSTKSVLQYVEMDKVRDSNHSTLGIFRKNIAPLGISYVIKGATGVDNTSNNLFGKLDITSAGVKSVYANVMKLVNDAKVLGTLKSTPFTVPSGVFDNPNTRPNYANEYPLYAYVHPSIDYSATAIGGFKYWMMASSFASSVGDALWEDEDLFVSNDAKTWQRVRSLYETDKTYTTATLRLPPHDLAKANSRQYAFLPCPPQGTVLEMSMPANNGGAAVERQTVTLTGLPWKHDPFLMIDGGYVYTYHTFILPYADRDGGKNKFIVCVRTDNGIDWDVVRSDGSTMRLTEESSKTLFTKSADGKYNFIHYVYSDGSSNPEIIKYGEGDYEFYYGANFSRRFKGTTPYTFDFETIYPIQEKAASNHPTLFLHDGVLNLITNDGVFYSTDRGVTFSNYAYYPLWFGGLTSFNYKKSTCVGEGGKFIVCDVVRTTLTSNTRAAENGFSTVNKVDTMSVYEYPSVTDFLSKANNGLVDGYVDVQIDKVNYADKTRVSKFVPSVSLRNTTTSVNAPLQRIKIADLDCKVGDTVFLYVTLNSRNGAEIQFGGIDIT